LYESEYILKILLFSDTVQNYSGKSTVERRFNL